MIPTYITFVIVMSSCGSPFFRHAGPDDLCRYVRVMAGGRDDHVKEQKANLMAETETEFLEVNVWWRETERIGSHVFVKKCGILNHIARSIFLVNTWQFATLN